MIKLLNIKKWYHLYFGSLFVPPKRRLPIVPDVDEPTPDEPVTIIYYLPIIDPKGKGFGFFIYSLLAELGLSFATNFYSFFLTPPFEELLLLPIIFCS